MCGIAGIFRPGRAPVDQELLARMTHRLEHRGPDGSGFFSRPGVGLGHRRLSIIDIEGGAQPMVSDNGNVCLTYNGEVYNFRELRAELEKLDVRFHTRCDTEVILNAYLVWGEDCVSRLRGMFAFAIWDESRQQLFLARDRLGIKPLFYSRLANGDFIFGSELKALVLHPGFDRSRDAQAIEDYFAYSYIPEPKTIYRNTWKLEPGHCLTVSGEEIRKRAYWQLEFRPGSFADEQELQESLIERLDEAVEMRMIADVPLGAFLSGGVDSSAVVAMMSQHSDKPVTTCSIAFDRKDFDESDYARRVAGQYHTDHHQGRVASDDFALIDQLSDIYDEPYADSSALPTYRVCELARKSVTVALSGDGGDENFAGYRRYKWQNIEDRARSWLPLSIRQPVFGSLGRIYPKLDWAPRIFRAKSTFQSLAKDSVAGYFHSVSILHDGFRRELFSDAMKTELGGYSAISVLRDHARAAGDLDPVSLVQYLDFKTYLVGDILTKVDRASMAHSLEVRVPLLDHKFVEWVATLPASVKLKNGEGKYLFKKSLEKRLPKDILYRPKMGFGVPIGAWFRGPLAETVRGLSRDPLLMDSGYFNRDLIHRIVADHQSGFRDHSAPIWLLFMFRQFLQRTEQL